MTDVRGHDVVEEPHAKEGRSDASDGGGDHVGDGRGDLDGEQTRDAHQESEYALRK